MYLSFHHQILMMRGDNWRCYICAYAGQKNKQTREEIELFSQWTLDNCFCHRSLVTFPLHNVVVVSSVCFSAIQWLTPIAMDCQDNYHHLIVWIREDPFPLTPPTFGHCPFGGGSKRLPRWFGALTVFGSIQPCRMVKMARKKVPQSARLSAGSNRYLGNAQMEGASKI